MKFKPKSMYILPLLLFTSSMVIMILGGIGVNPAMGHNRSDEAIALWVADRMGLSQPFDMPIRHYVDRTTLISIFKEGNQKAISRWQAEYGDAEAQKILDDYLENVLGLFDETTLTIYVADFIDSCTRQAIFAHEMVHYFQNLIEGIIPEDRYSKDQERFIREMRAYKIQDDYTLAFCKRDKGAVTDSEADDVKS
jgi:hypothetical protein